MNFKKVYLQVMFALVFSVFLCGSALAENLAYFQANTNYQEIFEDDTDIWSLDPGVGGQAYDAEFLAIGLSADRTRLFFGLQTGIELEHGSAITTDGDTHRPGDLSINFGDDTNWDYGLRFWESGFSLLSTTGLDGKEGWDDVAYLPAHSVSSPWRVTSDPSAVILGSNTLFDFSDTTDSFGLASNLLEGWIDASAFGLTVFNEDITAHWTMYCGNDWVETTLDAPGGGGPPVPEPTTILLFGIGLLGLAGFGRKKN